MYRQDRTKTQMHLCSPHSLAHRILYPMCFFDIRHSFTPPLWRHHFFEFTSFKIALFSIASASSFFNWLCSTSRARSLFASDTSKAAITLASIVIWWILSPEPKGLFMILRLFCYIEWCRDKIRLGFFLDVKYQLIIYAIYMHPSTLLKFAK